MKYTVIIQKKILNNKDIAIVSFISSAYPSIIKPTRAVRPIAAKHTRPKDVGYLSFSNSPLLLKNPCFLSKFTPAALATRKGTPSTVDHNEIKDAIGYNKLLNSKVIAKPNVIPTQNTKFQKLSLFRRVLMKCIQLLISIIIKLIIPCFRTFLKVFTTISLLFMLAVSPLPSFAEDLQQLIKEAEQDYNIPSGLLTAIASVESGFKPYALNISGKTVVVSSKAEGKAIIEHYLQRGYQNIDVGVMQVNYHWHRKNFATLEEMLIPKLNIEYAAKLLSGLYKQYRSWSKAVRYYHSARPDHQSKYSRKVLTSWQSS